MEWQSESDKLVLIMELLREIQVILELMGEGEASLDLEEACTKLDEKQNRLWVDNFRD